MERGIVVGGAMVALSALAAIALHGQAARQAPSIAEIGAPQPDSAIDLNCNESKPQPAASHPGNTSDAC